MIVLKIILQVIWSQSNLEGIISFHCLDEDYWLTTEETDHSCLRENVAYSGNDINYDCDYQPLTWKRQTPIECIALCQEISECSHFTWIDPNVEKVWVSGQRRCCLKRRTKSYSEIPMKGRISGSKYCGKCSIALPPWFYDNTFEKPIVCYIQDHTLNFQTIRTWIDMAVLLTMFRKKNDLVG